VREWRDFSPSRLLQPMVAVLERILSYHALLLFSANFPITQAH
jgi:hypothetical protein